MPDDKKYVKSLKAKKDVEGLIKLLDEKSSDLAYYAVEALGELGDKRAVPPLIKLIREGGFAVQQNVKTALGLLGDPRAVDPLIQALKDKILLTEVFENIEKIGKPAIATLKKYLKDKDYWIR